MEEIYGWIGSLVFYLILMTMILSLIPDKKYEKYLRLFTGMIFILLVFGPFADLSGLEARMAGIFERLTFQNDAKLLQKEIEDAAGSPLSFLLRGGNGGIRIHMEHFFLGRFQYHHHFHLSDSVHPLKN